MSWGSRATAGAIFRKPASRGLFEMEHQTPSCILNDIRFATAKVRLTIQRSGNPPVRTPHPIGPQSGMELTITGPIGRIRLPSHPTHPAQGQLQPRMPFYPNGDPPTAPAIQQWFKRILP